MRTEEQIQRLFERLVKCCKIKEIRSLAEWVKSTDEIVPQCFIVKEEVIRELVLEKGGMTPVSLLVEDVWATADHYKAIICIDEYIALDDIHVDNKTVKHIIIHELTHLITPPHFKSHGKEFDRSLDILKRICKKVKMRR